MTERLLSARLPVPLQWGLYVIVAAVFVGVLVLRGGPGGADAPQVVVPTTLLSEGHLNIFPADAQPVTPPGYEIVAAPFVAALRPLIGASDWCVPASFGCIYSNLQTSGPGPPPRVPRWYRSQAALVILVWLVLELGLIGLLHAMGRGGTVIEGLALLIVAVTPATTDAVVTFYHPEDLLCMGLICFGIAAALRERWMVTGVLIGAAFLAKQFALLALIPLAITAPDLRKRAAVVGSAAAIAVAAILPFFVSDPVATMHSLGATAILTWPRGLAKTFVSSITYYSAGAGYAIGRYGPLVLAFGLCVIVPWLSRRDPMTPSGLIGLVTACLATRLVFQIGIFSYYFLATSVFLVCLDCAKRRWPIRSALWIALTSLWWHVSLPAPLVNSLNPVVLFAAACGAIWIGLGATAARPVGYSRAPSDVREMSTGRSPR